MWAPPAAARTPGAGTTVGLWLSDVQEAFVTGIAAEFTEVPHRYCGNHVLRDLTRPVTRSDGRAKVRVRKKVRGLRARARPRARGPRGRRRGDHGGGMA